MGHISRLLFAFSGILMLLAGCKKPILNETDFLPEGNLGIHFTDTLSLITSTVSEAPLLTNGLPLSLWGVMNDAVFGRSHAEFYSQVLLSANEVDFGQSPTLDSVVLSMEYAGKYGDLSKAQTLIVYRLTEAMDPDADYYSNHTFTYGDEIGRVSNFTPNTTDSVTIDGNKLAPQLRVRLSNDFGNALLGQAGTGTYDSDDAFLNFMKGIYVAADSSTGGEGIIYFDLLSASSKLTLYYRNTEGAKAFDFVISNDCATSNYYHHNYAGSVVQTYLNNPAANGDSLVFSQSMSGLKGLIKVPHLDSLGHIVINQAELVITQVADPTQLDTTFSSPGQMTLNGIDSLGNNDFVSDQFVSTSYFGGSRVNEGNAYRYKFNLAIHYQEGLSNENQNSGIYLLTFPSTRIADRVILGGGNHSQYRMKLNLTYTKID